MLSVNGVCEKSEKNHWDNVYKEFHAKKYSNEKNYEQFFLSQPYYKYVQEFFGDIKGKRILDLGCGNGWISIYFARSNAHAYCCDISSEAIEKARQLGEANGVNLEAEAMPAENLIYEDNFFDYIFGNACLHHTKIPLAKEEILRTLKKGGKAAFIEPLSYNPILKIYRRFSKDAHSPDEHPLNYNDILIFKNSFRELSYKEFQLFTLPDRIRKKWKPYIEKFEDKLTKAYPSLSKYCSMVVIRIEK